MNVVEVAKDQVKHLVEAVVEKVVEPATTSASPLQAITIARSRPDVVDFFKDPENLSVIFGDVAEVETIGLHRLRWTFALRGHRGPVWECVLMLEDDHLLRFVDVNPDTGAGAELRFRDAPQNRGTEVIAWFCGPGPGALTGALAFKALYRARALLMTGEVPTIEHNSSARHSSR